MAARDGVAELVERLRNLHDGPSALPDVVALGDSAVPALETLLRAPSQAIYHHRYLAADALAAIPGPAATAALTRALRDSVARRPDPASLESEGVIVNRIAEHLSLRANAEITQLLLDALRTRPYPQCALALGRLGERRAIPLLVECLYDDAARSAAVEALRRLGGESIAPVIDALLEPRLVHGLEPPSRIDGRAAAARLLGELAGRGTSAAEAEPVLRLTLRDRQRSVRVEAALALVRRAGPAAEDAARILVSALDELDWSRADTIMRALTRAASSSEPLIVPLIEATPADESGRLRRLRAVEMAGRLGARSAISLLASLSNAADPALRLAAVSALDAITATDPASIERFLEDGKVAVRQRAADALSRRGALAPESAVRLLGDSDFTVRSVGIECLRAAGPAAVPALRQAVRTLVGTRGLGPWHRLQLCWRAWRLLGSVRRQLQE